MVNAPNAASNARVIKVEISRAKSYLNRYELMKSIEAMLELLSMKRGMSVMGAEKSDIDLMLSDYVIDFNKNNLVREFLESVNYPKKPYLTYVPGKDVELVNKLTAIKLKMAQKEEEGKERAARERQEKCDQLLAQGKSLIEAKEFARARVSLKTAAEQFGSQPGVLLTVGTLLLDGGSPKDAVDFLRQAVDLFPADPEGHRQLVAAYVAQGKLSDAEEAYKAVLKQFGEHPKTLLNLAKLQLQMHKPYDAADTAKRAYDLDNTMTEAKELFDRY